ncbi:MAG: amidohydrolase [Acidimicrobiaceae bacterium]|nr:amidohydrolase [Acidimicrobiaceae bacterium]
MRREPIDVPAYFAQRHAQMVEWRHHLHRIPELAFDEHKTAGFVADRLASWGVEVHTGLAGTGVVGMVGSGDGPSIGLRADMDALAIEPTEQSTPYGI